MPVNFLPLVVPLLLIAAPVLVGAIRGFRAGLTTGGLSLTVVTTFLLSVFMPGWRLQVEAERGNALAQYRLAKWYCIYPRQIDRYIIWPFRPDPLASYHWLEMSAAQGFPPALYALGVHLKYGIGVPQPRNWKGPAGNVFRQPDRGQLYIDQAIARGYVPVVDEDLFIYHVFCELYVDDPYD